MMCDIDSVLSRKEVETIAGEWHCSICQITVGTLQETPLLGRVVGDLRHRSCAVLLGAQHQTEVALGFG